MAEDVTPKPEAEPEPELLLVPTRRDRARQTSYRFRFGILYVALAAIVGAGVGTFVVLASRPAPPEAAAWSSWAPSGSKLARVRQIADRIPKAYLARGVGADEDRSDRHVALLGWHGELAGLAHRELFSVVLHTPSSSRRAPTVGRSSCSPRPPRAPDLRLQGQRRQLRRRDRRQLDRRGRQGQRRRLRSHR